MTNQPKSKLKKKGLGRVQNAANLHGRECKGSLPRGHCQKACRHPFTEKEKEKQIRKLGLTESVGS